MKTVIIENIISPYEIARFSLIQKAINDDLLILFQSESDINRNWSVDLGTIDFKYKVLPDIPVRLRGKDVFTVHLNFSVYHELTIARPDVVISCGWDSLASYLAYLYCRMHGIKYVLWAGSTVYEQSWRRTLSLPLVKYLVRKSDSCIAYGSRAREYLMHLGANERKIFLGWNTVDNSFFSSNASITRQEKELVKSELGITTSLVVLYVGQLIERKGVHDLLRAFSRLKQEYADVTLLMIGTGREKTNLLDYIQRTHIADVILSGFVDYTDLPKYFGISDLLVLPSREEVWGLVINEAMACGLPVITTKKVGASVDLVKHNVNGFVVRDSTPDDLLDALLQLVSNNELRRTMGETSSTMIGKFTMESTAEGVRDAINYAQQC
jgi:glycosyltransferase involved in cell wall biosynthesis